MKSLEAIIGKDIATRFVPIIREVLARKNRAIYRFTNHDEFQTLMQSAPKEANSQYMKEQIYRAHFASMSSIARNLEWLDGMAAAYEKELSL